VYLPKEGILATGDLLVHPVPFAYYGSFIPEWIASLKKLRGLEAKTIVPGHGPLMQGPEYLDDVIKLLESLNAQVNDAVKRGLGLEDTKKAVNLDFVPRAAGG
jgi:glyoxylase-like metal-dependent hydrolase (beta-lactamase superfamily II)